MEITGKVVTLLPLQSGQGKSGTWKKQEFIVEIPGQFSKKVCLSLWGEKVDEYKVSVGDEITASINLESREYNNRWYTDVRAWKIQNKSSAPSSQGAPAPVEDNFAPDKVSNDELPF